VFLIANMTDIAYAGQEGSSQVRPSITTTFGDADYPVSIGDRSFTAKQLNSSVLTTTVTPGEPIKMKLLLYDDQGPQNVRHVEMYVNMHGSHILNDLTETLIIWDSNKGIQIINPYGIISDGTVEQTIQANKVLFTFNVTFAKEFDASDIVFSARDSHRNNLVVLVQNALEVSTTESIKERGEYSTKSASDSQISQLIGNDVDSTLSIKPKISCINCVQIHSYEIDLYKEMFPLTVWTDSQIYDHHSTIKINGYLKPQNTIAPILLVVTNPIGNVVTIQQLSSDVDGNFSFELNTESPLLKQDGEYILKVQSGAETRQFKTIFTLTSDPLIQPHIVPEFGSVALLILISSIISLLVLSKSFSSRFVKF
jgi:predicted secreted protein with PEFG-CTERM motif